MNYVLCIVLCCVLYHVLTSSVGFGVTGDPCCGPSVGSPVLMLDCVGHPLLEPKMLPHSSELCVLCAPLYVPIVWLIKRSGVTKVSSESVVFGVPCKSLNAQKPEFSTFGVRPIHTLFPNAWSLKQSIL